MGVASSATSSTIIMSSTWASVVPAGKVPKDYPHHFDGLYDRPVMLFSNMGNPGLFIGCRQARRRVDEQRQSGHRDE